MIPSLPHACGALAHLLFQISSPLLGFSIVCSVSPGDNGGQLEGPHGTLMAHSPSGEGMEKQCLPWSRLTQMEWFKVLVRPWFT